MGGMGEGEPKFTQNRHRMVLGGITYHYLVKVLSRSATSKGEELSCELDYAILFWSWILSWKYPHSVDIIRIL